MISIVMSTISASAHTHTRTKDDLLAYYNLMAMKLIWQVNPYYANFYCSLFARFLPYVCCLLFPSTGFTLMLSTMQNTLYAKINMCYVVKGAFHYNSDNEKMDPKTVSNPRETEKKSLKSHLGTGYSKVKYAISNIVWPTTTRKKDAIDAEVFDTTWLLEYV